MKPLKIISFILVFTCSLVCIPHSAEDSVPSSRLSPEEVIPDHPKGFISDDVFIEGIGTVTVEELVNQAPMLLSEEDFPPSYDATSKGLITSVKNQQNFGTCWAFSSISAIETNMIKKGYKNIYNADYSELHHAYFAQTKNTIFGDGQTYYTAAYGYYGGNNPTISSSFLAGWQGVTNEEDFPYPPQSKNYKIPEDNRYKSVAHLQDYLRIPNTLSSVKKAILEFGSVSASYYDNTLYSDNFAFYQTDTTLANHAITIVGWDDNYEVSNFEGLKDAPPAPGAWKIKNSWGEHWGDNGYFWISYYEPSLKYISAFNAEPADNYQIIHQYDGAAPELYLEGQSSANIFTAFENEVLKAVGVYNITAGITCSVKVYLLEDGAATPMQGKLIGSASDTFSNIGYHTVTLDTPLELSQGDRFSVVVSLSDRLFAFEGDGNTSKSGESFIFDGNNWYDGKDTYISNGLYLNNACIKAYATNETFTVSFEENGGSAVSDTEAVLGSLLDIPVNPTIDGKYFAGWYKDSGLTEKWDFDKDFVTSTLTLYAAWSDQPIPVESITLASYTSGILTGNSITLSCKVSPYYATDSDVLWTTSSNGVSISNGIVTGIKKGSYTITASASDGSGVYGEYKIQVYDPMRNIESFSNVPVFKTTDKVYFKVSGENVDHYDFYVILPSGSGIRVANVPGIFSINYTFGEGEYSFYAVAYDALGNSLKSSSKTFWVSDSPMLIARRLPEGYQAGGFNGNETSKVFIAYYKDDTLLSVSSIVATGTLAMIDNNPEADIAKIMWWDFSNGVTPVTEFIETDLTSDDSIGETFTAR